MGAPWNNWFHCTAHVYGAWLRGDPRGWRTRHHREHVEGDYKHPPKREDYERLYALSKRLMKRDRVKIAMQFRELVLLSVVDRFDQDEIQLAIASLNSSHLHLLGRFPDRQPKHWLGKAKYNASMNGKWEGFAPDGGFWSKGSKAQPVRDRRHQLNTFRYIFKHRNEGAFVYVKTQSREGMYPPLQH